MKKIILNDYNLSLNEIDEEVTKVRALIINSENQIIVGRYNGIYLLPGGSIDHNENLNEALKREIKEETGININNYSNEPFLFIEYFNKNYPKQGTDAYINKLVKTYYYIIYTDEQINMDNIALTEREKKYDFSVKFINIDNILNLINSNITDNPRSKFFQRELSVVLDSFHKESICETANI